MTHAAQGAFSETTVASFLGALAARTPAPAGGAAAGLSAAVGAALLAMVARYTTGPRYAEREQQMLGLVDELGALEARAVDNVRADQAAFGAVAAAYELPKDTDEARARRSAAIKDGLREAIGPPLALAEVCTRLAELARVIAEQGHQPIVSDVGTGAACIGAAIEGTLINLTANSASLPEGEAGGRLADTCAALLAARDDLRQVVEEARARYRRRTDASGGAAAEPAS